MDDHNKRTIQAIIACVLVAMIYTQVVLAPAKKNAPPTPSTTTQTTSTPLAVATTGTSQITSTAPTPSGATAGVIPVGAPLKHPSLAELQKGQLITVETGKIKLTITTLGARVSSFQLKDYKQNLGETEPLDMVDNPDGAVLPLGLYVGQISDDFVSYTLKSVNDAAPPGNNIAIPEGGQAVLSFEGVLPDGTGITKKIDLKAESFLFNVSVALAKPRTDSEPVWLEWAHYYPKAQEKNSRIKLTHLTYLDGYGKVKHVPLDEIPEGVRDFGTSQWVSLGDLYFMATLIPSVSGRNTILGREGEVLLGRVAGTPSGGTFTMYVGPKDYKTLSHLGFNLERSIDLGWFTFLAYPLLWMIHYLHLFLGNYGLAIIALTLIVKSMLLPLTKASLESMKKMQQLQPEINALRERIKDPNQLNQEILGLYKRKRVNPAGGCLPILIQLPVFLGLYQALLNSIELRHSPFALWIQDLSAPESLHLFGIGIPVMVLIMASTMMIQQWTTPSPTMDPAQKKAMMIMPFVFAIMFIVFPMPAGLVLYWLVNNLISITQQVYLRREGGGASAYKATFMASIVIFGVAYILTLI